MPADSILVSAFVVVMFIVFAGALAWASVQAPGAPLAAEQGSKRRPF